MKNFILSIVILFGGTMMLLVCTDLCCIPQPLACRTGLPYSQIKDRDTSNVSFYTQTHRGSYMHLLCGFESIQGIGAHAESLRD